MKNISSLLILLILLNISSSSFAYIKASCLNEKGRNTECEIDIKDGSLTINYKEKKLSHLNKQIPGEKISRLTGGEYSRRRVAESITTAVLLAPVALFALFSKKKMDTFGVEYRDSNDKPQATMISIKKKYGVAIKNLLQSVSGKSVEYEEPKKSNKKDKTS